MANATHTLVNEACQACLPSAPALNQEELGQLKPQLPEWHVVSIDGVSRLQRIYSFADYAGALAFTNRVAAISEEEQHHPEITLEWGKVTVNWWTHSINGLHRNDAIMAAKTDALL